MPNGTQITHISQFIQSSGGPGLKLMQNGFNPAVLRTNSVLRKEEWIHFDDALVPVARQRLVGVGDLIGAGLTLNLPNAMGTTIIQWEEVSDMDPAEVSMDGLAHGPHDRPEFDLASLPIFIAHKDFHINLRTLESSRKLGQPLDTTALEVSTRLVAELNENILFKGNALTFGGASVTGYTTAANRNTGSLTGDWALAAQTGEIIIKDILAMITAAHADNMYGPYRLYVPASYWVKLADDYKANSDRTILERIEAIPSITGVRPSDDLLDGGTGEVVLVQFTKDVVDMVVGQQPTVVEWDTDGGFRMMFKVFSILVPRIKNDFNNRSGIAHFSV